MGLGAFSGSRTGKASREEVLACDAIDVNCGLADVAVLRVLDNEREESAGSASLVRKQGSLCEGVILHYAELAVTPMMQTQNNTGTELR